MINTRPRIEEKARIYSKLNFYSDVTSINVFKPCKWHKDCLELTRRKQPGIALYPKLVKCPESHVRTERFENAENKMAETGLTLTANCGCSLLNTLQFGLRKNKTSIELFP